MPTPGWPAHTRVATVVSRCEGCGLPGAANTPRSTNFRSTCSMERKRFVGRPPKSSSPAQADPSLCLLSRNRRWPGDTKMKSVLSRGLFRRSPASLPLLARSSPASGAQHPFIRPLLQHGRSSRRSAQVPTTRDRWRLRSCAGGAKVRRSKNCWSSTVQLLERLQMRVG